MWNRLVLADIPFDQDLCNKLSTYPTYPLLMHQFENYSNCMFNFEKLKEAWNKNEDLHVPLCHGDHHPVDNCMQALVPCIFPLRKGSNDPSRSEFQITETTALANIAR